MATTPQLAPLVRGYLALDASQLSTTTIIDQLQQGKSILTLLSLFHLDSSLTLPQV